MSALHWRMHARLAGANLARAHRWEREAESAWASSAWGAWAVAEEAVFRASRCRETARQLDVRARAEHADLMGRVA